MENGSKKSRLKIIIPVIIAMILIIIAVVLVKGSGKVGNKEQANEPKLKASKYVDLRGIYVDKSDEQEHPDEALIYVLYTVKSEDKNISFYTYMANNPGTALTIKINNTNEYKDTIYSGKLKQNFRNTGYENLNNGQKVLSGTSMQCIGAFRVSKNDLKEGGIIELTLTATNSFKEIFEYKTEDIKYFDNAKELLKAADNETYEKAERINQENVAEISKDLEKQIYNYLQENYFQWYISTIRTQIEFEGNRFNVSTSIGAKNGGTYEIRNKVILLHYDTGMTNELPYEFKDGEVSLTGTPE